MRIYRGTDKEPRKRLAGAWWTSDFERACMYTYGSADGHIASVAVQLGALKLLSVPSAAGVEGDDWLLSQVREGGYDGARTTESGADAYYLLRRVTRGAETRHIDDDMSDWWDQPRNNWNGGHNANP